MNDTQTLGLPEAAQRLGVPVRVLRRAIRNGVLPTPGPVNATVSLSEEWIGRAVAAVEALPQGLSRTGRRTVPEFARYPGTSAWRKYSTRVREYAHFVAAAG